MKKIETIALVAPCGVLRDIDEINKKISILEKKFNIKKYYNESACNNYLADSDDNRIRFFEQAFKDESVDLVLQIRGGFGAIRIVDRIDYGLVKDKYFLSSSDGTILLMALNKKTNVKTFHGLMLTNGFLDNLDRNIEIIEKDIFNINLVPIKGKSTQGVLFGGNLSSLVSLFPINQYLPKEDIILFLEDLNEPLYKIDRMLYQIYRYKELREKIKGIIFGDFYLDNSQINPLIDQYSKLFNVFCAKTDDITHKKTNITIPYGKKVYLKIESGKNRVDIF